MNTGHPRIVSGVVSPRCLPGIHGCHICEPKLAIAGAQARNGPVPLRWLVAEGEFVAHSLGLPECGEGAGKAACTGDLRKMLDGPLVLK
ncbi:hypothetical protein [Leisingera sp. ANG-M1]|uniref:hypothetical protein n=1 Tax=Leisingera sp. ANG-M1 TaxID=1577895 RepID=UPI00126A17C3|nr:hypothetical protein [Leisingera sp. ANG-M1]